MKTAFFDLISGASGDMILGALVDAGLPFSQLESALAQLHLPEFELLHERVMRGPFAASKVDVRTADTQTHRHLPDIEALVRGSGVPVEIQDRAMQIFERMVTAEAGIHGQPRDQVHLHELGAVDTIVDVVGALTGLQILGIERVVVSPFPLGRGLAHGAHGTFPLPAPATVALLRGAPVIGVEHALETVTPTAAAILTEVAAAYGSIPAMRLSSVGYGAGTRTTPEPNVLRVMLGEVGTQDSLDVATLVVLETNIDNMNPEGYGYVLDKLFAGGALDAYLTPIYMKKNRPGVMVNVLCRPEDSPTLHGLLFSETTTLGIRAREVTRSCLPRRFETVTTPYGAIRIKIARWGEDEKAAPEFEDCRSAAEASAVPLRTVYEAALIAYRTG